MKYDKIKIANRIKSERAALDLTQQELAEKLYYSIPTVSRWERPNGNNSIPNNEQLARLSELFDCTIPYLLGEIDTRTQDKANINKATGLTKEAIEKLSEYKSMIDQNAVSGFDYMEMLDLDDTNEIQRFDEENTPIEELAQIKKIIPDLLSFMVTNTDKLSPAEKGLTRLELILDNFEWRYHHIEKLYEHRYRIIIIRAYKQAETIVGNKYKSALEYIYTGIIKEYCEKHPDQFDKETTASIIKAFDLVYYAFNVNEKEKNQFFSTRQLIDLINDYFDKENEHKATLDKIYARSHPLNNNE